MIDGYRLSARDEEVIETRIAATARTWARAAGTGGLQPSDAPALCGAAARAIHCTTDDLRDSEIRWIMARCEHAIALADAP